MHFWVSKNGNTTGPYAESQILSMWHNGVLTVDALCWSDGYTSWVPITAVIEQRMKPQSSLSELSGHDPAPTEYQVSSGLKAAQNHQDDIAWNQAVERQLEGLPPTQTSTSAINAQRDGITGLGCLFSGLIVMLLGLKFMHGAPVPAHIGLAVGITVLAWMRLVKVGKTPWLAVLGLVPFVNFIFAITCLVFRDPHPTSKTNVIVSWACFIVIMLFLNLAVGWQLGGGGMEINLVLATVFLPYLISITLHWKNTSK